MNFFIISIIFNFLSINDCQLRLIDYKIGLPERILSYSFFHLWFIYMCNNNRSWPQSMAQENQHTFKHSKYLITKATHSFKYVLKLKGNKNFSHMPWFPHRLFLFLVCNDKHKINLSVRKLRIIYASYHRTLFILIYLSRYLVFRSCTYHAARNDYGFSLIIKYLCI